MKIKYENVCSIRNAEVNFEPGKLIAIVGETNQGKSALFYTLVDAFTNSSNFKKWINNEALKESDKSVARISLTDDNGNWYQAEAGKNHINYRSNKIKYEKPGRKNIFELLQGQIPGLLYDPEDTRLLMNIQGEDSGFFPIDRTDSQIFRTYERLLSLSCTEDILRTIKLDIDDIDFRISDMTSTIQRNKEQLLKINNVIDSIDESKLQKLKSELIANKNALTRVNAIKDSCEKDNFYLNKVFQLPEFSTISFDILDFQRKISLLVQVNKLVMYETILSTNVSLKSYDISKLIKSSENLSKAASLLQEMAALKYSIAIDNDKLKDILNILQNIKVCPYCGKLME